jgi:hypothetical protein
MNDGGMLDPPLQWNARSKFGQTPKAGAMRVSLKSIILNGMFPMLFAAAGFCQSLSENLKKQVDAVIQEAYQSTSTKFPCKLKAGGKPEMLRWQKVDKCLNEAYQRIDWGDLSRRLQEIREKGGSETVDFLSAVEASLSAHALTFDKVFAVKDDKALLPLSNSVLKFLPADSLLDLPVSDKTGKKIGTYSGSYTFEKVGEISGAKQRHSLFQYTDLNGKMQSSSDRLLLDSFGVPWKDAVSQRGFRLPADKINLTRGSEQRKLANPK